MFRNLQKSCAVRPHLVRTNYPLVQVVILLNTKQDTASQVVGTSLLVAEQATLKSVSVHENLGSLFPAVVTGVDRTREFIECVHAKILSASTDIKLWGLGKIFGNS